MLQTHLDQTPQVATAGIVLYCRGGLRGGEGRGGGGGGLEVSSGGVGRKGGKVEKGRLI